jgi:hypothetical protein
MSVANTSDNGTGSGNSQPLDDEDDVADDNVADDNVADDDVADDNVADDDDDDDDDVADVDVLLPTDASLSLPTVQTKT